MSVERRFEKLNVWSRGSQRAPHKPLLVLYALGRWSRGERGPIPYRDVDQDLAALLKEFGPPRRSNHPEYPFIRLQNDGVWVVESNGPLRARQGNTDATKSSLLAQEATGRFSDEVQAALVADPNFAKKLATLLLDAHFPESLHEDILATVGLTFDTAKRSRRDPRFRQKVLVAYEYRCAICGFDVRIGAVSIALDAAHIRWHQAGGPDDEPNGLALCVLHHKLFDLGVFTMSKEGIVLVSDQVRGTDGFEQSLLRHHGGQARRPQRPEWTPAASHLDWHAKEVFKGQTRHPPR